MTEYKEKIEQIKDKLDNTAINNLVNCYRSTDLDECVYNMDDFNEILEFLEPWDIARAAYFGDFNPTNDYFRLNVYGNLESTDDPCNAGWIDLDELAEYAIDNDEDFGDSEIRELLDQWEAEEENEEEE